MSGLSETALASISSVRATKPDRVEAGAHHLRLAAQANRGPGRASPIRGASARMPLPSSSGGSASPRRSGRDDRARHGCAGRTACPLPRAASSDSAPATIAAAKSVARPRTSPASASAVETCVPLISARPSFGPSSIGARPARARPSAPGIRRPSWTTSPSPISDAARCGKRSEVARCADRTFRRDARIARRWRAARQSISIDLAAHAGVRRGARLMSLSASISRTTPRPSRLADAGCVRQDEVALQLARSVVGDARTGELAEAGVDAVDRPAFGDRALQHAVASFDVAPGDRTAFDGSAVARHRPQGGEPDAPRRDRDDGIRGAGSHRQLLPFNELPRRNSRPATAQRTRLF